MKFGKKLTQVRQVDKTYGFQYIQYTILKLQIKEDSPNRDSIFQLLVEKEVDRIKSIISTKLADLKVRWTNLNLSMKTIDITEDVASLITLVDETAEEMAALDRFVYYNQEGFRKIIKKYRKHTTTSTFKWLDSPQNSFFVSSRKTLNSMLTYLSDIYRSEKLVDAAPVSDVFYGSETQQTFERKSTKYWVAEENIFALKTKIIKHLPLYIFEQKTGKLKKPSLANSGSRASLFLKDYDAVESNQQVKEKMETTGWISSVYLDNHDALTTFHSRMKMREGAFLVRVRWYGDHNEQVLVPAIPDKIFVERKTHHESWVQLKSLKERFQIQSSQVKSYLSGEEQNDIHETSKGLSSEIQRQVQKYQLKPIVRTVYKRSAFQLPEIDDVRITLDTELMFVPEGESVDDENTKDWCRTEEDIEDKSDMVKFPYAVLEVKLKRPPPTWLTSILETDGVEERHKFSKFQHGCGYLFPDKCQRLPYWFDDQDITDITARMTPKETPEVKEKYHANLAFEVETGALSRTKESPKRTLNPLYTESPIVGPKEAHVFVNMEGGVAVNNNNDINQNATTNTSNKGLDSKLPCMHFLGCKDVTKPSNGYIKKGRNKPPKIQKKRATRRVKIEPKTFFANERTFIQWLTAAVLILTLSGVLTSTTADLATQYIGLAILPIALILMVYAAGIFYYRLFKIRNAFKGRFDDPIGPGILVIVLTIVMITLTVFRWHITDAKVESPCLKYELKKMPHRFEPSGLALLGKSLWACSDHRLVRIDTSTHNIEEQVYFDAHGDIDSEDLTFDEDGENLYIAVEGPSLAIIRYNIATKKPTGTWYFTNTTFQDKMVQFEGLAYVQDHSLAPRTFMQRLATEIPGVGTNTKALVAGINGTLYVVILSQKGDETVQVIPLSKFVKVPKVLDNGHKIGAIDIVGNMMYVLTDNKGLVISYDLMIGDSGSAIADHLPSGKQWEGLAVQQISKTSAKWYLAKDTPAEMWQYDYDVSIGFSPCK